MIKENILSVLSEFKIDCNILIAQDYLNLYQTVFKKFTNGIDKFPFWENINDSESVQRQDGWLLISDFINNEKVILFLDKRTEKFGVLLKGGKDLNTLLSNTFNFVFYITNESFDYLLCFNEHDFLIGTGKAKAWLIDFKRFTASQSPPR